MSYATMSVDFDIVVEDEKPGLEQWKTFLSKSKSYLDPYHIEANSPTRQWIFSVEGGLTGRFDWREGWAGKLYDFEKLKGLYTTIEPQDCITPMWDMGHIFRSLDQHQNYFEDGCECTLYCHANILLMENEHVTRDWRFRCFLPQIGIYTDIFHYYTQVGLGVTKNFECSLVTESYLFSHYQNVWDEETENWKEKSEQDRWLADQNAELFAREFRSVFEAMKARRVNWFVDDGDKTPNLSGNLRDILKKQLE